MRQEGIFRINSQGNAMFGLRRRDEYLVAVYRGYTVDEDHPFSALRKADDFILCLFILKSA